MSVLTAVEKVLTDAREPLHYEEITRRILKQGLWQTDGKTPQATVNAQLAMDIKRRGTRSRFQPPIDRILLQNLARADDVKSPHKRAWARLNWTALDEEAYYGLIAQLRECLSDGEPMWHLERYWTVTAS